MASVADTYTNLYDKIYAKLNTNFKPQSASTLKDNLTQIIQPSYQQQADERKQATAKHKANIITDASARGMGSSSWVSDMNNRANEAESKDLTNIWSNYKSALYSALMSRLNQQDELSLSAQNAAQSNALAAANTLYPYEAAGLATTGGGGGGGGGSRRRSSSGSKGDGYGQGVVTGTGEGDGTGSGTGETKSVANAMYWGEGQQKALQTQKAITAGNQRNAYEQAKAAALINNAKKAGTAAVREAKIANNTSNNAAAVAARQQQAQQTTKAGSSNASNNARAVAARQQQAKQAAAIKAGNARAAAEQKKAAAQKAKQDRTNR